MADEDRPKLPGEETGGGGTGDDKAGLSRRDFLRGATYGAAGAFIVSAGIGALAWPKQTVPSDGAGPGVAPIEGPAETSTPQVVKGAGVITVDTSKCVGCRICEYECAIFHEGVPDLTKSRIQVKYFNAPGPVDVPVVCGQCSDTPCIEACPDKVDALHVDEETGAIILDEEACTGCMVCVDACAERSGSIRADDEAGLVRGICDLCGGDPQCVKYCPSGAIQFTPPLGINGYYYARPAEQIAKEAAIGMYRL